MYLLRSRLTMLQKILTGSSLNGSLQKQNYVWGGAMNMCWIQLCKSHNNGPLQLLINDDYSKKMVDNFNNSPFSVKDLNPECYYVKSGKGPETQAIINTEVKQKFPKKTFPDLNYPLSQVDIISYAYFIKQVQYLTPFAIQQNFLFNHAKGHTQVKGFKATTPEHRKNVQVIEFKSDEDFVVRLKLKQANEELYLIKGHQNAMPQDIVKLVSGNHKVEYLGNDDKFAMPVVDLDVERSYKELIGAAVSDGDLKGYYISVMLEKIKFRIDEVGAKVQNQAVMVLTRCMPIKKPNVRKLIFDRPFWVVMQQKGAHPYFIAQINNAEFMQLAKK